MKKKYIFFFKVLKKEDGTKKPSLEAETLRLEPRLAANDAAESILIFHTSPSSLVFFPSNFFRNQYTGLDLIRP